MQGNYPDEAELLRNKYQEIKVLRDRMDAEAQKPLLQRTPDIRKLWYTKCTDYINLVSTTLKNVGGISRNNEQIANYFKLIIDTLRFRSVVGNESSIFTSAITAAKRSARKIMRRSLLRGESKQVWSDIETGQP